MANVLTHQHHAYHLLQALFAAGIILLVEKLFLRFVAISFHRKALADRIEENRLGLKALDRLSNAQPAPAKKSANTKKGHRTSAVLSVDLSTLRGKHGASKDSRDGHTSRSESPEKPERPVEKLKKQTGHADRKQRRRKAMASIIVDQVGSAIGQVALKSSKFNRDGDMGGLSSARRLARKLFGALGDHRSYLVVEGWHCY